MNNPDEVILLWPKEVVMEERRRFPRQAVHREAQVLFDEDKPLLDCVIFDLTNHGAGIQLADDIHAPQWFELSFDNFRSRRHCRLAWQRNDKIGACFS